MSRRVAVGSNDGLGPNAENVMHHPERWIFDWFYKRHDMDKADNRFYRQTETERRAAELHEGCRMPMEQARELAASEASQDWYARGQDWGLADALTAGQDGDWTLDDIARAYAAGAHAADQSARIAELVAVLARLCELNAAERPMARVWAAAQSLVDSHTSRALGPNARANLTDTAR